MTSSLSAAGISGTVDAEARASLAARGISMEVFKEQFEGTVTGGRVVYVELQATQEERLRRNETELRLAEKPSRRDLAASRERLPDADARYQLHSAGRFHGRDDRLRIENTALPPADVAERIIARFALPASTGAPAHG